MTFENWSDVAEIDESLARPGDAFIFKHSTRCGISTVANEEVEKYLAGSPPVPVYRVLVVEQRPLSNHLAETLGVRHQSPQLLLVRDGKPVWEKTHYSITAEAIGEALAEQGIGGGGD